MAVFLLLLDTTRSLEDPIITNQDGQIVQDACHRLVRGKSTHPTEIVIIETVEHSI